EVGLRDDIHVANATVDDQALPAVARGLLGEHVAQQGATQGAATVDDHHLAAAIELDLLLDQRVVLEAFDRDDLAAKGIATTEVAEDRLDHLDRKSTRLNSIHVKSSDA